MCKMRAVKVLPWLPRRSIWHKRQFLWHSPAMLEGVLKMKAVILTKPTESTEIKITECPTPAGKPGWVLVRIKAFGMNHSEQILRKSEISAPYIQKPIIPGIECVGEIADASDTAFTAGQKVIALMGGMGRKLCRICPASCTPCFYGRHKPVMGSTCGNTRNLLYRLGFSL